MASPSCSSCRFCVPAPQENTGFCYRNPPQLIGPNTCAYPPVKLDTFWCGEHAPAKRPRKDKAAA